MQREFLPYANLWSIIHKWKVGEVKWMNDPFETIDALDCEKFIEESS